MKKIDKVLMIDPATGIVHRMTNLNAHDMKIHCGWLHTDKMPEHACEACGGCGIFDNACTQREETCWHCGGEGIDPTA